MEQEDSSHETFPFLSLPPELRNTVYAYATQDPHPYRACLRLRNLKPSSIRRVSQQLRAQALPVFFTVNTILVETTAPYTGYGSNLVIVEYPAFVRRSDARWRQAGTLQLPPVVNNILEDAQKLSVRTPKVQIRVGSLSGLLYNGDGGAVLFMGMLRRDGMQIFSMPARDKGDARRMFKKDVAHLAAPLRKFVEAVRGRTGYVGFLIGELRLLACVVRVDPREGARVLPGVR